MAQVAANAHHHQFGDVVTINVGGSFFTTKRSTLSKYPGSNLANISANPTDRDRDGNIFIDRNGEYFKYILDFLRDDDNIPPIRVYREVLTEASFYGLQEPLKAAERRKNEMQNAHQIRNLDGYERIRRGIIDKRPMFFLIIHPQNFPGDIWWEDVLKTEVGTGSENMRIKDPYSVGEAQSIVCCLLNDLRNDGFNFDVKVSGRRVFDFICLTALFKLIEN